MSLFLWMCFLFLRRTVLVKTVLDNLMVFGPSFCNNRSLEMCAKDLPEI